jgi:hypothetical protein
MADASPLETDFMMHLLEECSRSYLPLQVAVLHEVSKEFKLRIQAEFVEENAWAYRGLAMVLLEDDWLTRIMRLIFRASANGQKLSFGEVFDLVDQELQQHHAAIDQARDVLQNSPEDLAEEIQKAASKLKGKVS